MTTRGWPAAGRCSSTTCGSCALPRPGVRVRAGERGGPRHAQAAYAAVLEALGAEPLATRSGSPSSASTVGPTRRRRSRCSSSSPPGIAFLAAEGSGSPAYVSVYGYFFAGRRVPRRRPRAGRRGWLGDSPQKDEDTGVICRDDDFEYALTERVACRWSGSPRAHRHLEGPRRRSRCPCVLLLRRRGAPRVRPMPSAPHHQLGMRCWCCAERALTDELRDLALCPGDAHGRPAPGRLTAYRDAHRRNAPPPNRLRPGGPRAARDRAQPLWIRSRTLCDALRAASRSGPHSC